MTAFLTSYQKDEVFVPINSASLIIGLLTSYYLIIFRQMGIHGHIIGLIVKSIFEILIEIIFICKTCDKKYLSLPSFSDLFEEFFENLWFVLTFCFALIIEFALFEVISFYLYKSLNQEVNIGIWAACYQLITMGIIN